MRNDLIDEATTMIAALKDTGKRNAALLMQELVDEITGKPTTDHGCLHENTEYAGDVMGYKYDRCIDCDSMLKR